MRKVVCTLPPRSVRYHCICSALLKGHGPSIRLSGAFPAVVRVCSKGVLPPAQASDTLAELLRKQQATAEGGAAGRVRAGKGAHGGVPSLAELFHVGQLVRCVVTELHSGGQGAPSAWCNREDCLLAASRLQIPEPPGWWSLQQWYPLLYRVLIIYFHHFHSIFSFPI